MVPQLRAVCKPSFNESREGSDMVRQRARSDNANRLLRGEGCNVYAGPERLAGASRNQG